MSKIFNSILDKTTELILKQNIRTIILWLGVLLLVDRRLDVLGQLKESGEIEGIVLLLTTALKIASGIFYYFSVLFYFFVLFTFLTDRIEEWLWKNDYLDYAIALEKAVMQPIQKAIDISAYSFMGVIMTTELLLFFTDSVDFQSILEMAFGSIGLFYIMRWPIAILTIYAILFGKSIPKKELSTSSKRRAG